MPTVKAPLPLKRPAPVRRKPAVEKYGLTVLLLLAMVSSFGVFDWHPGEGRVPAFVPNKRAALVKREQIPERIEGKEAEHVRRVLGVLHSNINPDTYIAYSFTGDKRLQYWSVVYDNCIRGLVHLRTGRPDLAKKTVDYFIDNTAIHKIGWIERKGRLVRRPGWIVNIVDAAESRPGGRGIEHIAHTGPNIYLGILSAHIYESTGDERYLTIARRQWELVKDLQNEKPGDPNFGGVRMGPLGNPENPREQRLDFKPTNPSFYNFYNGEHAADFKGFSDLMTQLDEPHRARYEHASELIAHWDERIFDPRNHLFYIGTTEKRYFDPNIARWVEPGIIPMYPLDTSALKISAYGVGGLERFGTGAAASIRRAIDENFKVTVDIPGDDGKTIPVTGYDFVCDADRKKLVRFVELGPFGDLKVKKGVGRRPLLSDEWSNWVALADLRMARDYEERGETALATERFNAYYDNAIVNGLKTAVPVKDGLAYPYCHPLSYGLNQPVGFGWNTHHTPYAVIGGAARILGLLRFDPFLKNGGGYSTSIDVDVRRLGSDQYGERDKTTLYTEAELYLRDAWKNVRIAQINGPGAERYWKIALAITERMLSEHRDWIDVAKTQNNHLRVAKEKYPLAGVANLTERELEPVYRKYWALYHIGTAQFIVVIGNASLRDLAKDRGDVRRAAAYNAKALEAARIIRDELNYAQSFDQNGWLWQPAQALAEYVDLPHA